MKFTIEIPDKIINETYAPEPGDDPSVTAAATAACDIRDAIMEASLLDIEEEQFTIAAEPKLTSFTNHSKRSWSEEECRIYINAALVKLIADTPHGVLTMSVTDMMKAAQGGGTLAMSLSDDDKILTLTRVKVQ